MPIFSNVFLLEINLLRFQSFYLIDIPTCNIVTTILKIFLKSIQQQIFFNKKIVIIQYYKKNINIFT